MLVLRKSNFQGPIIRPIALKDNLKILYCLYYPPLNFLPRAISKIISNYFEFFRIKSVKAKYRCNKTNKQHPINTISFVYFS